MYKLSELVIIISDKEGIHNLCKIKIFMIKLCRDKGGGNLLNVEYKVCDILMNNNECM